MTSVNYRNRTIVSSSWFQIICLLNKKERNNKSYASPSVELFWRYLENVEVNNFITIAAWYLTYRPGSNLLFRSHKPIIVSLYSRCELSWIGYLKKRTFTIAYFLYVGGWTVTGFVFIADIDDIFLFAFNDIIQLLY